MNKKYKRAGGLLLAFAGALVVNGCFHYGFTQLTPGGHLWILPYYEVVLASLVAALYLRNFNKPRNPS